MIKIILIIALLIPSFITKGQTTKFKNIIVLLDLSNRIKPVKNPNQVEKDLQIMDALLASFEKRQRRFLFQRSKDKLSIVVANQRESALNIHQFEGALSIDMAKPSEDSRMNKPVFDKEKKAMKNALTELYDEAVKSKTTGADIWSYFRDKLKSELKPSSEYHNYIIILTDGYMDLDKELAVRRPSGTYMSYSHQIQKLRNNDDWEQIFEHQNMALRPHDIDYGNLKALVLEVIPKDPVVNINELPILKKFWATWFEQMNISFQMHTSNDNTNVTANVMEEFVFK